jgi:DNA repair protein RadC
MKELPENDRPRERLVREGPLALSDAELLAILLRTGSADESVLQLAQRLVSTFTLKGLQRAKLEDFCEFPGIKLAKASELCAALELGRRVHSDRAVKNDQFVVTSPQDVSKLLMPYMRSFTEEHVVVVLLNTKNRVIKTEEITWGGLNSAAAHPREVFEPAVRLHAAHIIIAHNHPSGDIRPSGDDIALTKRLVDAGRVMGINVLDHVIFGDGDIISLKELGHID